MPQTFGDFNTDLTRAIKRVAGLGSERVCITDHAYEEMANDDIDQLELMQTLKHGSAYGPELRKGKMVANVVHRNLKIRVSVGGLDAVQGDWSLLTKVTAVTAMRIK